MRAFSTLRLHSTDGDVDPYRPFRQPSSETIRSGLFTLLGHADRNMAVAGAHHDVGQSNEGARHPKGLARRSTAERGLIAATGEYLIAGGLFR